jgi:alkylation response protein AidB-like acyl-CoA dehydrogenase
MEKPALAVSERFPLVLPLTAPNREAVSAKRQVGYWVLDQGHRASNESLMSKVICSEAIARVADRSLQILGGRGITRDTVVERIFRDTRAFRIYDGPSEVHRWALGARIVGGKM